MFNILLPDINNTDYINILKLNLNNPQNAGSQLAFFLAFYNDTKKINQLYSLIGKICIINKTGQLLPSYDMIYPANSTKEKWLDSVLKFHTSGFNNIKTTYDSNLTNGWIWNQSLNSWQSPVSTFSSSKESSISLKYAVDVLLSWEFDCLSIELNGPSNISWQTWQHLISNISFQSLNALFLHIKKEKISFFNNETLRTIENQLDALHEKQELDQTIKHSNLTNNVYL